MSQRSHLGEFEELVLLAVAALQQEAYGLAVQELLRRDAKRKVTLATVHSALYRLEKKGLLRSHMGGATRERGGRSKRLFTITAAGRNAVLEKRQVRERIWNLIPDISPT